MLTAATATLSHTFAYDPLMRLYHFTQSGFSSRTYLYDGHDQLVLYKDEAFLARYVEGPEGNEKLF